MKIYRIFEIDGHFESIHSSYNAIYGLCSVCTGSALIPVPPCFVSIQTYPDRFVVSSVLFSEYIYCLISFDDELTPEFDSTSLNKLQTNFSSNYTCVVPFENGQHLLAQLSQLMLMKSCLAHNYPRPWFQPVHFTVDRSDPHVATASRILVMTGFIMVMSRPVLC